MSPNSIRDDSKNEDILPDNLNQQTEIALSDAENYLNSDGEIEKLVKLETNWKNLESFDSYEDNSLNNYNPTYDLSRDTYVNTLLANAGAPINPDAVVFSPVELSVPYASLQDVN